MAWRATSDAHDDDGRDSWLLRSCLFSRRGKEPRRRGKPAAQTAQERFELTKLGGAQAQRLELGMAGRCGRGLVVVLQHFSERGELAGVHIRRTFRDIA